MCGAGVIGASVSYYLSQKGLQPVLLEACAPACSASGKAGQDGGGGGGPTCLTCARSHPAQHIKAHGIIFVSSASARRPSLRAGGFLALDWCDGGPVGPLARKSFALHAELAESLGADCGYRRVRTHSISVRQGAGVR